MCGSAAFLTRITSSRLQFYSEQKIRFNTGKAQVLRAQKGEEAPSSALAVGDLLEPKGIALKSIMASYFTSKMGLLGTSRQQVNYGDHSKKRQNEGEQFYREKGGSWEGL